MTFDLFSYMEEEDDREQTGLITEVSYDIGWFVFASAPNSERFWAFSSKEEAEEQKAAANAAIDKHGWTNSKGKRARPFACLRLSVYGKDSVLNKDATWEQVDNYLVKFQKAYTDVFSKKSLPGWADGVEPGEKVWARVNYASDPENPVREMPDGTERDNLVPFIVDVYESREAALEAVELLNEGSDGYIPVPPKPENYPYDDWDYFYRTMVRNLEEGEDRSQYDSLSNFGVPKEIVDRAFDEAMARKEEVPF